LDFYSSVITMMHGPTNIRYVSKPSGSVKEGKVLGRN